MFNASDYLASISKKITKQVPRIDYHIHTNWTDGRDSINSMYEQACKLGMESILFSEHARAESIKWFPDFVADVRSLPGSPCRALVGVETRVIDLSGNIGVGKEILTLPLQILKRALESPAQIANKPE